MGDALGSHGTLVKTGDAASPETFTTVAELRDISGPSFERTVIDAPSQTTVWMEHVVGMLRAGEVTFDVNFIPTDGTHDASTGLLKDMIDGTLRNFQIVFPDVGSTTWSFSAYVVNFGVTEPIEDVLSAAVTLQVSGAPTLT